jgi:hypothetical protein
LFRELEPAAGTPACCWPADQVERWQIERLIPCANHLRLHREADLDKIAAANVEWGGRISVLADEHQAFGQSLDERANAPEPDQSAAIHD